MKKEKTEKYLKVVEKFMELDDTQRNLFLDAIEYEIKNDPLCDCECDCDYTKTELENEWNYLNNLQNRLNIAEGLLRIHNDKGKPYFNVEWIVKKILKIDDDVTKTTKERFADIGLDVIEVKPCIGTNPADKEEIKKNKEKWPNGTKFRFDNKKEKINLGYKDIDPSKD